MIKEISACNKMNFSGNVNEVIRAVLNFFVTKRICMHQKNQKHKNITKQKHEKDKNGNK